MGDGVNIAARLEGIAAPGTIAPEGSTTVIVRVAVSCAGAGIVKRQSAAASVLPRIQELRRFMCINVGPIQIDAAARRAVSNAR